MKTVDNFSDEYIETSDSNEVYDPVELSSCNDEDFDFSTIPTPTFDKDNRIDYVSVMKDYKSGDEELRELAGKKMIEELTGLIMYIIRKHYSSYMSGHFDDMYQSGAIGVLTGMKDYDPERTYPATYFYSFIVHEIQCYINDMINKTTPYYSTMMKQINRAMAMFENRGITYTNRDISIQTGIPLDTVDKVVSIMTRKAEMSLDLLDGQFEGPASFNPEEEFFKKESVEFLYKIMREYLTQEEVQTLSYLYGMGGVERLSLKDTAKALGFPIDKVKKLRTTALCKLRNSPLACQQYQNYKNDILELDDADAIPLFPYESAINSAKEMASEEIEF